MQKSLFFKNKKSAIELSLMHLLEIVLAIGIIFVLIYFSLKLSGLFLGKQEYDSTINNLEAMSKKISAIVQDDKLSPQTMLYSLPDDYILVGFNYQDQNPVRTDCTEEIILKSRPKICQSKACLCIYKNQRGITGCNNQNFDEKGTVSPVKCKVFEEKIVFLSPQKDSNFQGSGSQWKSIYNKWPSYNYLVLYGRCGCPWKSSFGIKQIYIEKSKEGENAFIFIGNPKNSK